MHDAFVGLLSYGRVKDSECINLLMGFHDSFAKKCNGFPCNSTFSCLLLCLSPFALPCSMFGRLVHYTLEYCMQNTLDVQECNVEGWQR